MSLRLGVLLLLTSGCATVAHDENTDRIDQVLGGTEPIPEPVAIGDAPLPIAIEPAPAPALAPPPATPAAPEGYRLVPGRRGRMVMMRDPNYLGVSVGDVHVGDVTIGTNVGGIHSVRLR